MYKIIAFAGKARSGKSTAAAITHKALGGTLYALADPIRDMLRVLGVEDFETRKEDEIEGIGASPRKLMQTLGTEWGRIMINEDLWLNMAKLKLRDAEGVLIISDLRFESEAEWVRQNQGLVVRIRRTAYDEKGLFARIRAYLNAPHPSERGIEWQDGDITIYNTGTLAEFEEIIASLAEALADG